MNTEQEIVIKKSKGTVVKWVGLVIILVLMIIGIFTYTKISKIIKQSNKFENYEELSKQIVLERERCNIFISGQSGDFTQFEYCKEFLTWSQNLPISQ